MPKPFLQKRFAASQKTCIMKKVLITGASGLIGNALIAELLKNGFEINTLTRKPFATDPKVNQFFWDIETEKIDEKAFDQASTIIHLAGAGVADERWTDKRKKDLWSSRINATKLLFKKIKSLSNSPIKKLINASAVGYYGDRGSEILNENSEAGVGFLSDLCVAWEKEADQFSKLGITVAKTRIGIVLSEKGGALPEMMKTVKLGVGGYFAKENLFYPWIHIDDIAGAFRFLIEQENLDGVYNFTAPKPVTHHELMQAAIDASGKHALLLPAPPLVLKIAMGEMADMLLNSQHCVPEHLTASGFKFKYNKVNDALKACFKKGKR
jgi:hypothetical protein